jgi:isocitrate lyase
MARSFDDIKKIEQLEAENKRQCNTIENYQVRIDELEKSLSVQELTREEQARYFTNTLKALQVDEMMVKVFKAIREERQRQAEKWGDQSAHLNGLWISYLAEEFGEVSKALNDHKTHMIPAVSMKGYPMLQQGREELITELIHTAAVAVAWLEGLK